MRRRIVIGIISVIFVVGIAIGVISSRAPESSGVTVANGACGSSACLRFPVVSGENLNGDAFTLPADFAGKRTLVIVPFTEDQQVKARGWLPLAQELAADPDLAYYNVPVFPAMVAPMRAVIRSGMGLSIADPQLRAATITLFLDQRDQFLAALDIPNTDAMQVFLLDEAGDVIWRGSGEYSDAQAASLRAAVKS